MASVQPSPPAAQPPAAATPPALRLLERLPPPPSPRGLPQSPTWSARLGRWVDRLLVS